MAGSSFGTLFKITTFGESHGAALGVIVDGCPAGIPLSTDVVQAALNRRRPGVRDGVLNAAVTARTEPDTVEFLSGVFDGVTTGTPVALLVRNTSQISKDYDNLKSMFRPGHADMTYTAKFGVRDYRGGGRASGRETAARVAAGAVARCFLERVVPDITVTAFTLKAAGVSCASVDFSVIEQNAMRAADLHAAEEMMRRVEEFRRQGDSCGGIIECRVSGFPAGAGEPVFDKLDAELAKAMLSVGAVKGIEFGAGFAAADGTGSAMNDQMFVQNGTCAFRTNNAGGILGGISNGDDIIFRVAVKPVPSIFKPQETVGIDSSGSLHAGSIEIAGRHDVCLCPRIVPVIEAMTWLTLSDMYLRQTAQAGSKFRQ